MKMNRTLSLALAGALSLSLLLAACGGKDAGEAPSPELSETPAASESAAVSEIPEAPDSAEPSDTPEAEQAPEASPAESAAPPAKPQESTKPSAAPTPTARPEETPAETPDTGSKVQAVWNSISALELPSFMDMDSDILSALYGIDDADLVEYIGKVPLMNVQATEFFIAQVRQGKMDTVKAGIAQRQADLEEEWSQYLPAQLELVKNYKLVTNGDYVIFAVTSYPDEVVKAFNDCTK